MGIDQVLKVSEKRHFAFSKQLRSTVTQTALHWPSGIGAAVMAQWQSRNGIYATVTEMA